MRGECESPIYEELPGQIVLHPLLLEHVLKMASFEDEMLKKMICFDCIIYARMIKSICFILSVYF